MLPLRFLWFTWTSDKVIPILPTAAGPGQRLSIIDKTAEGGFTKLGRDILLSTPPAGIVRWRNRPIFFISNPVYVRKEGIWLVSLGSAVQSAFMQLVVLGGVPFLFYYLYHRIRFGRSLKEVAARAGLCVGRPQYIRYALVATVVIAIALVAGSRGLSEAFVRENLAQGQFTGMGITWESIAAAAVFGVLQTGLTEELLFRGLIAGSLSRRFPSFWANSAQAFIFLFPHVPILFVAPGSWGLLVAVFAMALLLGWMRVASGSILGPWIIHAGINTTVALIAAAQTGVG